MVGLGKGKDYNFTSVSRSGNTGLKEGWQNGCIALMTFQPANHLNSGHLFLDAHAPIKRLLPKF